ncbi:MAG TPA: polyprenyl synthetase family protein [Thermoplasmata archaeon]|nr:polyprenyl synthetase family protein [Thermoplasmata archaeon]
MAGTPSSETELLEVLLKPYRDTSNANLQTMWEEYLATHPAGAYPSTRTMSTNARLFLAGKRYRYALALAGYRLLSGEAPSLSLERAACWLEWYHLYTLFLDDIIDEDERRRTLPSAWSANARLYRRADASRPAVVFRTRRHRYGASQAILDALRIRSLAERAIETAAGIDPAVRVALLTELTEVDLVLSHGQALDIDFEGVRIIPEEDYVHMSEAKTARLYMGAAATGAIAARAPPEEREALQEFAVLFAVAFQDRDDLLGAGVVRSDIGGSAEGDIRQGKRTRLYVLATQTLRGRDRAAFLRAYGRGPRTTRKDVTTVRDVLRRRVLPIMQARIEKNLLLARKALYRIPSKDAQARAFFEALLDAQKSRVR